MLPVEEEAVEPEAQRAVDIFDDAACMHFLRTGQLPSDSTAAEKLRIIKRAKAYTMAGTKLFVSSLDGERMLEVPCLHLREEQILCSSCMSSAGIMELSTPSPWSEPHTTGWGWTGVDLCGHLEGDEQYRYCMTIIKHLSKHVEAVPLRDKTAAETANAFLIFLARSGACAEVLIAQGTEFQGELDQLLSRSMIDHRLTSANHLQADGLTKRAVQTIKRALTRHAAANPAEPWTKHLPWVLVGYRMSVQASSKYSPYFMLHGRHPLIPPCMLRDAAALPSSGCSRSCRHGFGACIAPADLDAYRHE
jgi:hypothetical protein